MRNDVLVILTTLSILDTATSIDGGLRHDQLWVSEVTNPGVVFPLFAVLQWVFRIRQNMIDDAFGMGLVDHKLGDNFRVFLVGQYCSRDNLIDIFGSKAFVGILE